MKNIKTGLFVGKFMAYHRGHQACITQFSSLCSKELKLVLCYNSNQRVAFEHRKKWLTEDFTSGMLKNQKINLLFMNEDGIPDYPIGLQKWCNKVRTEIGTLLNLWKR